MTRLSPLSFACIALVILSAHVLAAWSLVNPEVAPAKSVFAAMVATAISMITGRFPI